MFSFLFGEKDKQYIDQNTKDLLDCTLNFYHLPIIYRTEHNITFFGLEKRHAFGNTNCLG